MTNATILHMRVEWFAEHYRGPKFHALICDPPYHLTSITERFGNPDSAPARGDVYARASRGFMGKRWDGGDIAYRPDTWAGLAEHLHPGGFGMAFASSRGWHRLAVAIEDAGLIIHPSLFGWSYGCLSEDTEILTPDGWRSHRDIVAGSTVMGYNVDTDSIEPMPVEKVYRYEHAGVAYNLRSDTTDQLVSPEHRCLVERGGTLEFRRAATLERQETVPVLESVRDVRDTVHRPGQRRISQAASLLADVCDGKLGAQEARQEARAAQGYDQLQPEAQAARRGDNVPGVRQAGVQASRVVAEGGHADLFARVQRQAALNRASQALAQGALGLDRGISAIVSPEDERPEQPGVEGRRYLSQPEGQLSAIQHQVRALPRRVYQHGAAGWIRDGAPTDRGTARRQAAQAQRSGASRRPQPGEQRPGELGAVRQQQPTQAVRGDWRTRTTLATVEPVVYSGIMWCVSVRSGAFVARRNGQVFVTGNSGFPKATRIDTQVDRDAGAEREVVGKHPSPGSTSPRLAMGGGWQPAPDITAPATDLAQTWQGHRYGLQALKPALEPIIVFQKPYQGRPVDNITATGAGALNIDGARIATGDDLNGGGYSKGFRGSTFLKYGGKMEYEQPAGRWPANLLLLDDDAAAALDAQSGESVSTGGRTNNTFRSNNAIYGRGKDDIKQIDPGYGDTGGASRFFYRVRAALDDADPVCYTAKASRAEREAGLEGFGLADGSVGDRRPSGSMSQRIHKDEGRTDTIRRNGHPTVKPLDLARYLSSLLLPPEEYAPRRLLVPFCGSGSEVVGGFMAGWDEIVGVEFTREYVDIARARLAYWMAQGVQLSLFDELTA